MHRIVIVVSSSLVMSACATTQPHEAAGIDYRLPRTDATVKSAMTLRSCVPLSVEADVEIVPEPGAQDTLYRVAGEDLASARIKRDLKVSLSDTGVITGINSANQDKTPEIIGNALKIAGTVVGIGAGRPMTPTTVQPAPLVCRPDVANALARADWLKGDISRVRAQLINQPTNVGLVKELNRATRELGTLQEGILHIETKGDLELNPPVPTAANPRPTETSWAAVGLDMTPFSEWFEETAGSGQNAGHEAALAEAFGLTWKVSAQPRPEYTPQPLPAASRTLRNCRFAIAVPAVLDVKVEVQRRGTALPPGTAAAKVMPAAQWTNPNNLCLDVGFGEQRSIDLSFNKFGQTTAFGWASEATAATVSGALAGYASDASAIVSTVRGSELAAMKAEIDHIETEQKLEELRRCKRIRDAGGDCTEGE